jgi:hypothetical protein
MRSSVVLVILWVRFSPFPHCFDIILAIFEILGVQSSPLPERLRGGHSAASASETDSLTRMPFICCEASVTNLAGLPSFHTFSPIFSSAIIAANISL